MEKNIFVNEIMDNISELIEDGCELESLTTFEVVSIYDDILVDFYNKFEIFIKSFARENWITDYMSIEQQKQFFENFIEDCEDSNKINLLNYCVELIINDYDNIKDKYSQGA